MPRKPVLLVALKPRYADVPAARITWPSGEVMMPLLLSMIGAMITTAPPNVALMLGAAAPAGPLAPITTLPLLTPLTLAPVLS